MIKLIQYKHDIQITTYFFDSIEKAKAFKKKYPFVKFKAFISTDIL